MLGLRDPARVSDELSARFGADRLMDLVVAAERARLVPHGAVTSLAAQVRLTHEPRSTVAGSWWPRLRAANGLESSDSEGIASPVDAVICGEAFFDHYSRVLRQPNPSTSSEVSAEDRRAVANLVERLCTLSCGPYGVAEESLRVLAKILPTEPNIVSNFARMNPVANQIVRALDAAVRHAPPDSKLWNTFVDLLAQAPSEMIYRTYWLRALRRAILAGREKYQDQAVGGWAATQLAQFAFGNGEAVSILDSAVERRFAFWCLAEVLEDEKQWSGLLHEALGDQLLTSVVPAAQQMRAQLSGTAFRDGFAFTPEGQWLAPSSCDEILDLERCRSKSWSQWPEWGWLRPTSRQLLMSHLRDALLSPNSIRQRASCDVLRASGTLARRAACLTASAIYFAEESAQQPDQALMERAVQTVGLMGVAEGIDLVESVLKSGLSIPAGVLKYAVTAAGHLAHVHPHRSVGLMAWTNNAVSQTTSNSLAIRGIIAAVAYRRSPERFFDELPENAAVEKSLAWANGVLADPLLPIRSEPSRS